MESTYELSRRARKGSMRGTRRLPEALRFEPEGALGDGGGDVLMLTSMSSAGMKARWTLAGV